MRHYKSQKRSVKQMFGRTAVFLLILAVVLAVGVLTGCDSNKKAYEEADALLREGNYKEAAAAFEELGSYLDAQARAEEVRDIVILEVMSVGFSDGWIVDFSKNGTNIEMWSVDDWFVNASVVDRATLINTQTGHALLSLITDDSEGIAINVQPGTQFAVRESSSGYILLAEATSVLSNSN